MESGDDQHHNHYVSGMLHTSAIMAFQSSLSAIFQMSSLLGDIFFLVSKLFRMSVYCVRCLPLLSVPQIFPLCLYAPKTSYLFLMVWSRDLLYTVISITSWFDFFSVHDILIILLMCHISAASSLSRSFVSVQHSHPCRSMDHNYVGSLSVGNEKTLK